MSVQNELLGDVPESFFDRLNLDLSFSSILAFPHATANVSSLSVSGVVVCVFEWELYMVQCVIQADQYLVRSAPSTVKVPIAFHAESRRC